MIINTELRYGLLKIYGHDPLYRNVILSANQTVYEKHKKVLISIRGNNAMENLKKETRNFLKQIKGD